MDSMPTDAVPQVSAASALTDNGASTPEKDLPLLHVADASHALDDAVIELDAHHEAEPDEPHLTLILPEDAAESTASGARRLTLVTDDEDESTADPVDSSASLDFTKWAQQVSGHFSAPATSRRTRPDETDESPATKQNGRAIAVAADRLWLGLESPAPPAELSAVSAYAPGDWPAMAPVVAASVDTSDAASQQAMPASGGPILPPPPTPPQRIGAGRRVQAGLGWKLATEGRRWRPRNPLAGLTSGVLRGFRWREMWRTAGATAAAGILFFVVLRTIFA